MRIKNTVGYMLLILTTLISYKYKEATKNQEKSSSEKKVDLCFSASEKEDLVKAVLDRVT